MLSFIFLAISVPGQPSTGSVAFQQYQKAAREHFDFPAEPQEPLADGVVRPVDAPLEDGEVAFDRVRMHIAANRQRRD
jgi:hypothetical protein